MLMLPLTLGAAGGAESFDFGWRFAKGDHPGAEQGAFNDSGWRALALPHDWSIEGPYDQNAPTGGQGGSLPTGIGWYRKTFRLPESAKGKILRIRFDGVYENSTVWINGHNLGTQPYGYTTFEYDLTPHLVFGARDNVLAVRVDNSHQPNSRWYSGSGIYRHTWLRTSERLRIPSWGVSVTTPAISKERAVVRARVNVRNDNPGARTAEVTLAVLDASGAIVAQGKAKAGGGFGETALPAPASIAPGAELEFAGEVTLPRPQLWSPDTPSLYRLRATVTEDGRDSDVADTTFGVRAILFDVNRGFVLNGKKVILRGMCLHHEAGSVGAAVPDAVLRRRLLLLKEMGCNAVRTSHNPMAPEFYNLCDELGLLVMAEIFDEWARHKEASKFGYAEYFKDWHERDLTTYVRQNRNHPSIVIWSAGNEIREQRSPDGPKILRELVNIFHREDPTRPVTAALDQVYTDKGPVPAAFADLLDVVGYNYVDRWGDRAESQYSTDRSLYPARKFIGTEDTGASGERGSYPLDSPLVSTPGKDKSKKAIVQDGAPRGARYPAITLRAQALWKFIATHDYVAGNFSWTGFDYLGESVWPRKLSGVGPLDTCGFKKDSFYFYQSIWTTKPMIHLLPHWNWQGREGQTIPVVVFTNANFAELFLNGRSLGVKSKEFPRQGMWGGWNGYARPLVNYTTPDLHFSWDAPYEPGELRAVAYDIEGKVIAEARVRTAGAPAALELGVDRAALAADGRDVAHVTVRALDAKGVFAPLAKDKITFEISGPATLIGVDNGNPASHESYKGNTRALYAGMALALVQSEAAGKAGVVKVTARAKGLKEATVEIDAR